MRSMPSSPGLVWTLALTLALTLVPSATAQVAGLDANGQPLSLPFHDARLVDGRPTAAVRDALAATRDQGDRVARQSALTRMSAEVPALRFDEDEIFGTPRFLRSWSDMLTTPRDDATPAQVVRDFVDAWPGLFEIDAAQLDATRTSRDFGTRHNGVTHLTLQQQIDGLDVFGAELRANVTAAGELINISSTILPRPADGFDVPAAALGPVDALRLAAADAGVDLVTPPTALGRPSGASQRTAWRVGSELRSDTEITTELLLFPRSRTDVRPAWSTVVPVPGTVDNTYETIVDATTGEVLRRWNRLHFLGGTEDVTMNVWTGDSPQPGSPGTSTPNGFQFPEVPRTLLTIAGADVAATSPAGWVPDGGNETFGNNVDAYSDLDNDNQPDLPRPQGSPYRVFDFPVDLSQSPGTYVDATITNLFYWSNVYHDRLYELGWDEAALNFQDDNFGLGGVGGDRFEIQAQDGGGTNNANYNGTGPDGTKGYVQMYVFDAPDPDVDGGLDADLVYHEYSHGLSIRLSGSTLTPGQSGGMGEGWGDYFGICLNAEPGDDPHDVYPMSPYAVYLFQGVADNYYFGIRRYPYTTDMGKSPLTYADVDPLQIEIPPGIPVNPWVVGINADEVHNVGEIWCQALLEARAIIWDQIGFAANDLMMQLVVDGLKLMPANPNLLWARDAILSAELIAHGGLYRAEIWAAFAKRGMGASATSPPTGSTAIGVVEAFDLPQLITIDYPSGQPAQLGPSTTTTFPVHVGPVLADAPIPGTGELHVSVNGGPVITVPMVEVQPDEYEATLPAFSCFDQVSYFVTVDSTAGLVTDPPGGLAEAFFAEVFTTDQVVLEDAFELDLGWTVGGPDDDATKGIWVRVDPNGTSVAPEDDHTADPGTLCWVTGQGPVGGASGVEDVDLGQTTLTSPVFDLSEGDARIGYWRWFSNGVGGADVFVIDISNDGGASWANVEVVGPEGEDTDPGWFFHEFTASDVIAPTSTMRLRFIASDEDNPSVVEAAIDDVRVHRLLCAESCQTDLGFGGPGAMALSLCGPPFETGATNDLLLTGAPANGLVYLVFGLAANPSPFKGGFLVPVPILVTLAVPADGDGEIFATLPGGGGPFAYYLQAVAPDGAQPFGFALSNTLEVQVGP